MRKIIAVFGAVLAVVFIPQFASAAPTRAGLLSALTACKGCSTHYIEDLRKTVANRQLVLQRFPALHAVYAPGAKSKKEISALAETFYLSMDAWYHFLTRPAYKPDPALLKRIAATRHLETGARAEAAMMLYCTTRKLRYGLLALRLQPLQATVFEHAADPQFGALLGRLLAEYLAGQNTGAVAGVAGLPPPSEASRAEYAALSGAAFFQRVPPGLIDLLFSQFKSLQPSTTLKVSRWEINSLTIYPFLARRVIGHLEQFGPHAERQFIRALARQDCVAGLRDIVKAYPKLARTVRDAGEIEAIRARKKAAELKSKVKSRGKAGPPTTARGAATSQPAVVTPGR